MKGAWVKTHAIENRYFFPCFAWALAASPAAWAMMGGECVHSITGREGTRPRAGCCKFDKISLELMPCVFASLRSLFYQSF